jgi:hypothetical protein
MNRIKQILQIYQNSILFSEFEKIFQLKLEPIECVLEKKEIKKKDNSNYFWHTYKENPNKIFGKDKQTYALNYSDYFNILSNIKKCSLDYKGAILIDS